MAELIPGASVEPRVPPSLVWYSVDDRREIEHRLRRGELQSVRRGCYRVTGHGTDEPGALGTEREQRILAQVAALEARLRTPHWFSHTSAALLWGCWTWRLAEEVHLVQGTRPGVSRRPGDPVMRHVGRLPASDRAEIAGVPVTALPRTIIDCARTLPIASALVIADSGLRIGTSAEEVRDRAASMRGARGILRAERVLRLMDARSGSPGETLVRLIAHEAGLPRPDLSHPVRTALGLLWLDIAWPDLRVAVEFDGDGKYGRKPAEVQARLLAEKRRNDALDEHEWRLVHVTWEQLGDPARIVARIRHAMAQQVARGRRVAL